MASVTFRLLGRSDLEREVMGMTARWVSDRTGGFWMMASAAEEEEVCGAAAAAATATASGDGFGRRRSFDRLGVDFGARSCRRSRLGGGLVAPGLVVGLVDEGEVVWPRFVAKEQRDVAPNAC